METAQRKFEPRGGEKTSKPLMILLESSDPAESEAVIQVTQTAIFTLFKSFFELCSIPYNQKNTDLCNREIKDD